MISALSTTARGSWPLLAGIGATLGAIQRHLAQAHQPSFLAEPQHLNAQPGQGSQVTVTEGGVFPAGLLPPGSIYR